MARWQDEGKFETEARTHLPQRPTEKSTAFHEAGHAVAAHVVGVGIRRAGVSIVPDSDSAGRCYTRFILGARPDVDKSDRTRIRAEKRIMIALAGPVAQRKFNPRTIRNVHGSSDYREAIDLLMYFVGGRKELETYLRLLELRTHSIIERFWPEIQAVALELLKQKRLTAKEVVRVFG